MKSFIAILACFAVTALAVPSGFTKKPISARKAATVNINLANDQSGANGVATFTVDGLDYAIATSFAGTGIANANFKATSAQLNAFPQTPFTCSIKNAGGTVLGTLTAKKTYADLDGKPNVLTVMNLKGGSVNCAKK
jgi:hypothetical protein